MESNSGEPPRLRSNKSSRPIFLRLPKPLQSIPNGISQIGHQGHYTVSLNCKKSPRHANTSLFSFYCLSLRRTFDFQYQTDRMQGNFIKLLAISMILLVFEAQIIWKTNKCNLIQRH
jgi:hypothetical protein